MQKKEYYGFINRERHKKRKKRASSPPGIDEDA
jgi:hypothetical protein